MCDGGRHGTAGFVITLRYAAVTMGEGRGKAGKKSGLARQAAELNHS